MNSIVAMVLAGVRPRLLTKAEARRERNKKAWVTRKRQKRLREAAAVEGKMEREAA